MLTYETVLTSYHTEPSAFKVPDEILHTKDAAAYLDEADTIEILTDHFNLRSHDLTLMEKGNNFKGMLGDGIIATNHVVDKIVVWVITMPGHLKTVVSMDYERREVRRL